MKKWFLRNGLGMFRCGVLIFLLFSSVSLGYKTPGLIKSQDHIPDQKKVVSTGIHTITFHPHMIVNPNEDLSEIFLTWTSVCHKNNASHSGYVSYNPRWIDQDHCVNFKLRVGGDIPQMNQVCYWEGYEEYMATDWFSMSFWAFDAYYKPAKALNEDVNDEGYRSQDYIYISFGRFRCDLVDNYDENRIYIYRAPYDRNKLDNPLGTWERVPEADPTAQDPDLLDNDHFDVDFNWEFDQNGLPFNFLIEPYYSIHNGPGYNLIYQGLCGHDIGRAKVFLSWREQVGYDPPVVTWRNRCYEVTTGDHTALQLTGNYVLPDNTIFVDAAYTEKYLKVGSAHHKICTTAILYANGVSGTLPLWMRVITNDYIGTYSNDAFTWPSTPNSTNTANFNTGFSTNNYSLCKLSESLLDNDNITICPKMNKWYLLFQDNNNYMSTSVITLTRNAYGQVTGLSASTPIIISGYTSGDVAYVQQGAAFTAGGRIIYLHDTNVNQNILADDHNPWDGPYPVGIQVEKNPYWPKDCRLAALPLVVTHLDPSYNAAWFNNNLPESIFLAFSNSGSSAVYGKVSQSQAFKDIKNNLSADISPQSAYQLGSEEDDCYNFHTLSFSSWLITELRDNNCTGDEDIRKIPFIYYNKPNLAIEDQVYSTKLIYYYDLTNSVNPGLLGGMQLTWRTNFTVDLPETGATPICKCSGTSSQMSNGYNTIEVGQGDTGLNFFHDTPIMTAGWYFWRILSQGVQNEYEKDIFKYETSYPKFRFNYIDWEPSWIHGIPNPPFPGYSCSIPFPVLCDEILDRSDIPGVTTDRVDCISGPGFTGHWLEILIPDCYSATVEIDNLQGSQGGIGLYSSCAKYPEDPIEVKCGYGVSVTYKNESGGAQTIYALVNYHQCEDPVITISCDDMSVSNDECCGATTMAVPESYYSFNLSSATKSANTNQCQNYPSNPKDVWYRIASGSAVWVIYMETSDASNSGFIVFTGDCDSLTPVDCSTILGPAEQYIEFKDSLNDELYIKLYGTSSHSGQISWYGDEK